MFHTYKIILSWSSQKGKKKWNRQAVLDPPNVLWRTRHADYRGQITRPSVLVAVSTVRILAAPRPMPDLGTNCPEAGREKRCPLSCWAATTSLIGTPGY